MGWARGLARYWHTLRHLKPVQFTARARLLLAGPPRLPPPPSEVRGRGVCETSFLPPSPCRDGLTFSFLNLERAFDGAVDWDCLDHGLLWAYNLNYFQWLDPSDPLAEWPLLEDYLGRLDGLDVGRQPYPTSLRVMAMVRFLAQAGEALPREARQTMDASLASQARMLAGRLEFHLLGNHLLENAFALLMAGTHLGDEFLACRARSVLGSQLREQILPDGAHFERSPMYHRILLGRVLDAVNLVRGTGGPAGDLLPRLEDVAGDMLAWQRAMTFSDGRMPLFNDSAEGIAPEPAALDDYARRLGLVSTPGLLPGPSGYRLFRAGRLEAAVDAAPIGPDYIPGHAHSDTLSFELRVDGAPYVVDPGVSTYEAGPRRRWERSTEAHNTVQVGGVEQSETWGAFRVARRARVTSLEEGLDWLEAAHDGYARIGIVHRRRFAFSPTGCLVNDVLEAHGAIAPAGVFRIHFHPGLALRLEGDTVLAGALAIRPRGAIFLALEPYYCPQGFNRLVPATCLRVDFKNTLETVFEMLGV